MSSQYRFHGFGGGGVTVWVGVSSAYKTELVVVQVNITGRYYLDNIINPIVIPAYHRTKPRFGFMDDNARPHRARIVTERLQQVQVPPMEWPSGPKPHRARLGPVEASSGSLTQPTT